MRLGDVLKLDKQPHSLSIIKDFLEQPLSHMDYQAAFSYYLEIAVSLELYDLAYDEGIKVADQLTHQVDTDYTEKILKHIILSALKLHHFEEAKNMIELRKSKLPMLKQYLGILDDISYKKSLNLPYLEDVLRVLKDVIPDQTKIFCHQELFAIYKKDHQYEMALKSLYELYNFDLQHLYQSEEYALLIQLNRLDELIEKAQKAIKISKDPIDAILALIEAYMLKGDHHKASTLEAEYEALIDEQEESLRKKAYQMFIDLYQHLDNKPSLDYYQKKLKSLSRSEAKKTKVKEEEKPSEIVYIEKIPEKGKSHQQLLKTFEASYDLIMFSHMIDEKLILRDYFRIFFMHVETYVNVKDHIIYLPDQTPNLFHYKKERLYDKTIPQTSLEDTVIKHILTTGEELIESTKTLKFQNNPITQKPYADDVTFIYAFPMGDIGVYMVHLEIDVPDPGIHYDLFKLLSAILYTHMADEKTTTRLKKANRFYASVIESPIMAYRELSETKSTYNQTAMDMFHIDRHHHLELFLRDLSYEHVHLYKETIQRLLNKPGDIKTLTYRYQEKHILERLYGLKIGEEHVVMSLFTDQTKEITEAKALIEKATIDPETDLANEHALTEEFDALIKDKASLILIELDHHLKHIYGTEQMNMFFKEFAQHTKKFFSEGKTYRYDFNQILVCLPYNDIRSVTKIVKDYVRYLEVYESKVLRYEKFNVRMGILRYPVVTTEKNKDKLMRFLDIALEKAKREKEEPYVFFVFRDYEDELFEQQVIDYLNLAIEQQDLGLVFHQITDIKKNRVWQYESELALLNLAIDGKYLMSIAKKRNRLVDLEKYHIKAILEYLVQLEKSTERLIKLTIPISKETFVDPTFNPYLLGQIKAHGMPHEFIRLKLDMELKGAHYQTKIQELIDRGITLDTTSLDMALTYPFHALHIDMKKSSPKWQSYIVKMKELMSGFNMALIVRNVKTKDQKESLEQLGIQYVEGPIYKELPAPSLIQKIKESL